MLTFGFGALWYEYLRTIDVIGQDGNEINDQLVAHSLKVVDQRYQFLRCFIENKYQAETPLF